MIDLYSWDTGNGRKIAILLEELDLPYEYHPVDIGKGEQFAGLAVNLLVPGHTRTTGFDEQNAARREMGMTSSTGAGALQPEHIVPLAKFLAQQEASSGITGKCFDTVTWNIEHGLGGPADWVDPEAVPA